VDPHTGASFWLHGRFLMTAVYLCGGDETPGPRGTDCPNRLHDHPLPSSYVEADVVAHRRIAKRWSNRKCPDCGIYGWEKR